MARKHKITHILSYKTPDSKNRIEWLASSKSQAKARVKNMKSSYYPYKEFEIKKLKKPRYIKY